MAKVASGATNSNLPEGWGDKAKAVQSNWFKFEKVGDNVKGTLIKKSFQKSNRPGFADQWVYELKTEDGSVFNVGMPVSKDGTIKRLNNCKVGEIIGMVFSHEIEPSSKGFAAAKAIDIYTFGMDPNWDEMSGGEKVEDIEF